MTKGTTTAPGWLREAGERERAKWARMVEASPELAAAEAELGALFAARGEPHDDPEVEALRRRRDGLAEAAERLLAAAGRR